MMILKKSTAFLLVLTIVFGLITSIGISVSASDKIDQMTMSDKITQMLMVDFRYWDENTSDSKPKQGLTVMNDQVRQIVEDYNFGAIINFAQNVVDTEQTLNLMKEYQEAATKDGGIPMLIATDQEGGSVYRLATGTALPGNMALGATYAANGTKYAMKAGEIIGSELSVLGINTNLAPVVDVNNNPNNPVIGLRSYSDNATMVGELAAAEIEGMNKHNVIACVKHFPGHGDTEIDSHYGLPVVDKPLSVLKENELKPYETAINKGVDMVMTAHILYPGLENDKIVSAKTGAAESLPATMSDDILTGLLKKDMGFDGIVITDAMNMAGITEKWNSVQACVIAIQAGVDMICMPTALQCLKDLEKLDAVINGIEKAVNNGEIPISRINDAVNRILTVKKNRNILDYNAADYSAEKALSVVGCEANRKLEREIAAAAVTVVKNENGVLPLKVTEKSKILMLVPYDNERGQMIMGWNRAKSAGIIPEGAQVDYFRFNGTTTVSGELLAKLNWADIYIVNSEVTSAARMANKHWLSELPDKFCNYAAANGKTAIVSSVDKPYDVQLYPNADAIVAAYGFKGSSVDPTEALVGGVTDSNVAYGPNIVAAVEVIFGIYGAQGKLPLDVPAYNVNSDSYTNTVVYNRGYGLTYDSLTVPPVSTVYSIDVTHGKASATYAASGTVIIITAEQIDGRVFSHWEVNGAAVADKNAQETTVTVDETNVTAEAVYYDCECKCHQGGITGFFFRIVIFFRKIFGNNFECICGKMH